MAPHMTPRRLRTTAIVALAATLGACASFTPNGGMSPVVSRVSLELGKDTAKIVTPADAAAVRARVDRLLAKPLTADAAVQIALVNNRGLQADYNALGISEAAYVTASLPPSPTVMIERVSTTGELDIERRLIANLLELATLPKKKKIAETEFRAAQFKAIEATFRTAAETRRAYYKAVASRETVGFLEQARTAADAAADLTRKLGETGATTKLNQARTSVFYAEVSAELAQARLRVVGDREALTRQLGLWGREADYKLPPRLPKFPKLRTASQVEAEALRKRVDLIAMRIELDALAQSLGLTESTRAISLFDVTGVANYSRTKEDGMVEKAQPKGFEVEIQVPIFDGGETRVRQSRETYMQGVNHLLEKAVNIRSEARQAYSGYRGSYDIAQQYQIRILPLRKTIDEQQLLQYNGMLVDAFEILTTTRESIASNVAAIAAKRDFFVADVDFQAALIGGGSGAGRAESPVVAASAAGGGGH